ncbi:MAG TPA: HutD family protein [Flavobacterium sp.]|nr:HutD family protein [Flavobacterium sp.]
MQTTIIRKESIKPNTWDGGETFEYFIYPPTASYANRDFLFRISSASITKIPSNFTKFDNYQRFLVMLDNDLEINRNGQKEVYTQDKVFKFASNDDITSYSLGNDFNLMVGKDVKKSEVFFPKDTVQLSQAFIFVFAKEDTILSVNEKDVSLNSQDLLLIENMEQTAVTLKSLNDILMGYVVI